MTAPDYLAIGHITKDLLPGGGTVAGGTVLYAAITALRLGVRPAIFTAAADLPDDLSPAIAVARTPSDATSTFENRYTPDGRQQWLHAAASPLRVADLPATWRACPLVHLGPLLQECPTELLDVFPNAKIIVTPQGWMRYWDPLLPAQVFTRIWQPAPELLRRLSGVVLSIEDVRGDEQVAIDYARHCPLVALTRGNRGSTLFVDGVPHAIPARPAREVDPTGAGDVFAAALLIRLHETGDPVAAAHFAAQVAGAAVEGLGTSAIPTREQL